MMAMQIPLVACYLEMTTTAIGRKLEKIKFERDQMITTVMRYVPEK